MTVTIKTNQLSVSEILNELIKEQRLTISELARRVKLPQPTIYRIASGHHSHPHQKTLERLAKYFAITLDQLCGREIIPWLSNFTTNTIPKTIPLLNYDRILDWPSIEKKDYINISIDSTLGLNSFAIKMPDESMEPIITKNSILIIDPSKTPNYRSFVIIKLKNCTEIVIRQMIKDGDNNYIRALSPDFHNLNMIRLSSEDKILGVIIEVRIQFEEI